jgi:hypothetical protein
MADKDDENEKDPKVVQLFKQNNQRGTKTVKQILSEITEGSISWCRSTTLHGTWVETRPIR